MLFVLSPCNSFDKIRRLSGKLSSLPATFQALGVLVSYAVGLALDWHQLAWFSFYFAFPIPISSFPPFWTRTRLTSTGMVLLSSYSLSLSSVFCNHQLVTHFLNLAWIWIICSSQPIIFGNHNEGGSCLVGPRVAEPGSLSSAAKMAMKIFVKRVFTIFASNASFLRVIANLQN